MINVDRIIIGLFALVFIGAAIAIAGQSSVPITPGTGANFGVVTTTAGSDVAMHAVCDGTTGQPCATVNGNALSVGSAQSGTWNIGVTGTVVTSGNDYSTIVNTVSVSPTGNTPITCSVGVTGTVSTSPTGNTPITGSVGVTGTVSTSPTGNTPITGSVNAVQSGSWQVGLGTLQTSPIYTQLTTSTSAVGSVTVLSVGGTVSTSPTGNTPVTGTVAATQSGNWSVGLGTTAASGIFTNIIGTISVSPTGNTPITGSVSQSGNWSVGLATTQASPIFAQLTTSTSNIGNVGAALGTTASSGIFTNIIGTLTVSTASNTQPTSPTGTTPVIGQVGLNTSNVSPLYVSQLATSNWNVTMNTTTTSGVFVNGSPGGFGVGSLGAAVPTTSAPYQAGRASNAEPTAGSNGNLIGLMTDLVGKLIVSPYANKENILTWSTSSTTSTSGSGAGLGNVLIPALGAGVYPYITSLSCYITQPNTSQVITVSFSNVTGTSVIYRAMVSGPTSQNANFPATFPTPLGGVSMGAANSNTQVVYKGTDGGTLAGGLIGCNAGGYKGT